MIQEFFVSMIEMAIICLQWLFGFFETIVMFLTDTATHISNVTSLTAGGMVAIRNVIMFLPAPVYSVIFGSIVIVLCIAIIKVVT